MATVFDVAAYILDEAGPMAAMKLQKLCYYGQAWALVWDEKPLFKARIEAWANGPVVPALYAKHRGKFMLGKRSIQGRKSALTQDETNTIDAVVSYYATRSSQWLSDLTHQEEPWRKARAGLAPGVRGHNKITHAAMAEYYGSL